MYAGGHEPKKMHRYEMPTIYMPKGQEEAVRIKRVLSKGLKSRLKATKGSVASLARELGTSRSVVQRVLDPQNTSITLQTMVKAAASLGYRLELKLEPRIDAVEEIEIPVSSRKLMIELGLTLDRMHR